MVKMLMVIGRRADLTHTAFLAHLGKTHLEVVDRVPEFRNRVRHYMQNHLFVEPHELAAIGNLTVASPGDGIIEVWFDDVDAIRRAFSEPRYYEIVRPDELAFGDVAGAWGEVTDDVPILEKPGFTGHIKVFFFVKRKTGSTHAEFLRRWDDVVRPRLTAARAFHRVGRLVENHVRQDAADRLPNSRDYDLIAEMWLESRYAVPELASDHEIATIFRGGDFLEPASTLIYIGEEKPEAAEWLRRSQARA